MSDGAGILADILEHPERDGLRLVYADWLEEQGQEERAEFIRVQIELALIRKMTGKEPEYDPERLWAAHSAEGKYDYEAGVWWCDLFPRGKAPWGVERTWRRGFIQSIRCPLAVWMDHGAAIVQAHPVERVELSDRQAYYDDPTGTYAWLFPMHGWESTLPVHFVPWEIGRMMPPECNRGHSGCAIMDESEDPAAILSLACLLHAGSPWALKRHGKAVAA